MAAPTTFQDLPDDMLHEIFGRVLAGEPDKRFGEFSAVLTFLPPEGAHLALRSVCRRWRDIADWARLSTSKICVDTSVLADAGAIRARHPAAFKSLMLTSSLDDHSNNAPRAAASLINGSADLRRALSSFQLHTCCLPALAQAVTTIASCAALTDLGLTWKAHENERVVPSNVLAPLSALRMLERLVLGYSPSGKALHKSALMAPLPALPDAPRLTHICINHVVTFVPVGSDAAMGRLRRIVFRHASPLQELVDAEDPLLLRVALVTGTWQPSRLTGLRELEFYFGPVIDAGPPLQPPRTGPRAGSEWAPLASQVTSLKVSVHSIGYNRPSTGIVAGLGVLTALRELRVDSDGDTLRAGSNRLELVSVDRVRAPHLTLLECFSSTPASVAQFPDLAHLLMVSLTRQSPLNLRSLVARSSLTRLILLNVNPSLPGLINLAELFVGGGGWPVLDELAFVSMVLEWDATGLDGAPTAAEFADRARQLLPVLDNVVINEPHGRGALPDRSRVGFVVACRRHVVPALLGLRGVQ